MNAITAPGVAGGFGGVLEAFTNAEPDEAVEQSEVVEQVEDSSEGDEHEPDQVATNQADASDGEPVGEDAQVAADQQVGAEFSQGGKLAGDVALLLNNAASIDLAGLASQQLGDQVSIQQSVEQDGVQQAKPAEQAPVSSQSKQPQNTDTQPDRRLAHMANGLVQGSVQSGELQDVQPAAARVKPVEQPVEKQSVQQLENTQQQSTPAKVQVTQVAQSQVVDLKPASRRLEGLRSINEIASVAGKSRVGLGSESSGKTGADQGGMDLGNKSQTAAKLMQTKPSDERAMQRQQVMAQVQRGLASIMNTKGGSMKIRLSPEHLGEVNIQLTTKDGHVRVKIDAESDQTRSMLKDGLDGLRNALESRGVQVDDLSIEGREPTGFGRLFGDAGGDQHQHRGDSDRQEQGQEQGGENDVSGGRDDESNDEPRGIWTDLGLDAIA